MKNFEYIEEHKLIRKIWSIHDKIFSTPAKRFIVHFSNDSMAGYVMRGYDYVKENHEGIFKLVIPYDNEIPNLTFGDNLIIIRNQKLEKCDTNIEYLREDNKHTITVTTDFLHFRQAIITFGDCMEQYAYKKHINMPNIEQLTSVEKIIFDNLKG